MKKIGVLAKLTLLALGFLMLSGNVFSQSKIPVTTIKTEWNLFQEVQGIKFFSKKEIHTAEGGPLDVEYVIVKLENTTDKDLTVAYSLAVHYNMGCNGCSSREYYKTLTIPAHSSIEGNPSNGRSPLSELLINHNQKNGWNPLYISTENLIIK
jgi:hypothetical protein